MYIPATAPSRTATRRTCWRARVSRRRSSSSAGSPAGRRCRCRFATPGAGPRHWATPCRCRAAARGHARPPPNRRAHRAARARHRGDVRAGGRRAQRRYRAARGRDRRVDGPQRLREVVAAVGAAGLGPARGRPGRRRRSRSGRLEPGAARGGRARPAHAVGPAVSRLRRGRARPRRRRISDRGRAVARLARSHRSRSPDTTHPRDLSEGQRLALVLAIQLSAAPASCCSTSRPAASTITPSASSAGCSETWPPPVTRSRSRPTTWNSSRSRRTGSSSWPKVRSSPTDRPRR